MCEDLQFLGEMNGSEPLEQTQRGNRRVEVEPRRKARAQYQTDGFDRIHKVVTLPAGGIQQHLSRYHEQFPPNTGAQKRNAPAPGRDARKKQLRIGLIGWAASI